ncbi:MAG TPA: hypothetical protein VGV38_21200 [Pyrinomonadaceae bacterium]|nr:hypothetical protein [Pyrinomonadaceae bacterium]
MPPLVLDTDVLSFIFRSDTRASLYAPDLFGHVLTISFQTQAEMLRGRYQLTGVRAAGSNSSSG